MVPFQGTCWFSGGIYVWHYKLNFSRGHAVKWDWCISPRHMAPACDLKMLKSLIEKQQQQQRQQEQQHQYQQISRVVWGAIENIFLWPGSLTWMCEMSLGIPCGRDFLGADRGPVTPLQVVFFFFLTDSLLHTVLQIYLWKYGSFILGYLNFVDNISIWHPYTYIHWTSSSQCNQSHQHHTCSQSFLWGPALVKGRYLPWQRVHFCNWNHQFSPPVNHVFYGEENPREEKLEPYSTVVVEAGQGSIRSGAFFSTCSMTLCKASMYTTIVRVLQKMFKTPI